MYAVHCVRLHQGVMPLLPLYAAAYLGKHSLHLISRLSQKVHKAQAVKVQLIPVYYGQVLLLQNPQMLVIWRNAGAPSLAT